MKPLSIPKNWEFSNEKLLQSRLVARRSNRILDYFFGNIILFPHFKDNNVIGFTIKDLGQDKSEIKLRLFSRDSFYYQDMPNTGSQEVILFEGKSDLHSIIQFTDHNKVLALCGNQLTQSQLRKLLGAGITKVYLALDRNVAGKKATQSITKKLIAAGFMMAGIIRN